MDISLILFTHDDAFDFISLEGVFIIFAGPSWWKVLEEQA
jgi:hypothetical protein